MTLGEWLNSLTWLDHVIIFLFFALACFLSWVTLSGLQSWFKKTQDAGKYAKEFRITPFAFLGIAIFYTIIIYKLVGPLFTDLASATLK